MARPPKYSEAIAASICQALQLGATRTAASESHGIAYETFRVWMRSKVEFSALVTRAEAKAELRFTTTLTKAAQGTDTEPPDWRAAESWLKRRRRLEWGDNVALGADKEIAGIIAALFAGDAADGIGAAPLGIEP